jgi:hypothetical protein
MTQVRDINPVFLNCHISGDTLALAHQSALLSGGLKILFDTLSTTTLALTDFEHNGERVRVHAFTISDDGALEPWQRTAESVTSPPIAAGDAATVLYFTALAVTYEPTGEPTQDALDTFEPTTWQTKVRVDVPPKGSKPL